MTRCFRTLGLVRKKWTTWWGLVFDWTRRPFLAGVAFDSYNDPTGGVWKRYQDGVSISYTSPSCLAQVE